MKPNSRKSPPSPPGHWLVGHTKLIFKDPIQFPLDAALDFNPICKLRVGIMTIYITADAESVRQIFLSKTEYFKKAPGYKTLAFLGGNGLLSSEGDFWKRQRKLAQPGFHKEKIKGFLQTFIDCSRQMALKWEKYSEEEMHQVSMEMGELTMRVIGKTLFGIDLYEEAVSVPPDVKEVLLFLNQRIYGVPKYPIKWPLPSHRKFFALKSRLDKVVYKIIDDRVSGITSGDDLLQAFLEARDESGERMAREHVRDEVMTLFLAGFETSSVALTWVWFMLSQHPQVREQLVRELDEVIGDEEVMPEHIMKLPYTKAVIEETLRMYPPAYNIPRQLVQDMDMHGYRLHKGGIVLASVIALHRNPAYWKDPDVFDPSRFSVENQGNIVKDAYIPFGAGQRMCIGTQFAMLEMVAAVAVLARSFLLTPVKGYSPEMIPSITTNVSEGMPMHIAKNRISLKKEHSFT